jgi:hypothetical protein
MVFGLDWGDIKDVGLTTLGGGMIPGQAALAGKVAGPHLGGVDDFFSRSARAEGLYGGVDPNGDMGRTADSASQFGRRGMQSYGQAGQDLARQRAAMQGLSNQYGRLAGQYGQRFGGIANRYGRIAQGQDSISAEQLRQGLQQQQAAQMSMAAGARPQDASMAALGAARNMGDAAAGMSGQAAMAGLQERRDALGAQLGALGAGSQAQQGFMGGQAGLQGAMQQGLLTGRGQDANVALGGQGLAMQGYGGIENARTDRYRAVMGAPTPGEQILGGVQDLGNTFMKNGGLAMVSDRRAKTDIVDGDDDAEQLLKGLRSSRWRYKDERDGKGEFVTPMAQDLERTRAGRAAVIQGPDGKKVVHGARLAMALAGAAGNLDRRLRTLEGKK